MANAHENIDKLTILNDLDNILKRTYKDSRMISAEEKKYEGKQDISKKIFDSGLLKFDAGSSGRVFRDRNPWESGNIQQGIGIDDIFDKSEYATSTDPALSDFILKTIATPNMLGDLTNLLTGIYDPESEANVAKVRDVGGERKLDALTTAVESIHGDDKNILDIIKSLVG